jgi:hypothetical protein
VLAQIASDGAVPRIPTVQGGVRPWPFLIHINAGLTYPVDFASQPDLSAMDAFPVVRSPALSTPHARLSSRDPFIRGPPRATRTPRSAGAAPPSAKCSRCCRADEFRFSRCASNHNKNPGGGLPTRCSPPHGSGASQPFGPIGSGRYRVVFRAQWRGPAVAGPAIASYLLDVIVRRRSC